MNLDMVIIIANIIMMFLAAIKIEYIEKEIKEIKGEIGILKKRNNYCADEHRQIVEWLRELKQYKEQPEIIRCKDCKHWIPYDWMFSEVWQSKNIADYPEDDIGCDCSDMAMKANDFCSRGERRTE